MSGPVDHLRDYIRVPITDARAANAALGAMYQAASEGRCTVARGRVYIPSLVPGFALVVHALYPTAEDLTPISGKSMWKATFMRLLLDTAGLRIARSDRRDDDRNPARREYEVTVEGIDLMMHRRQWIGTYELDLTEGGARASGMGEGQYKSKLHHISQLAATGALLRAIVDALAIPRNFDSKQAAMRPVLVPCMEVHAASAPPEVQAMMTTAAIHAVMGAYGPAPAPALPAVPAPPPGLPAGEHPPSDPIPFDDETPFLPDDEFEPPLDDLESERVVTREEMEELKAIGALKKSVLGALGWPGGDAPIRKAVFDKAMAKYGGTR
jgi:hypothetical protein